MELSSIFSVSHLLTFLGGALIGCTGQYFADRFTDQRRRKEHRSEAEIEFLAIKADMRELLAEMADDFKSDESRSVREFVIAPNTGVSFNGNKPRFMYYEDEHPHLRLQVDRLEDAGYVDDITPGNAPIFRMREHFVSLIKDNA